MKILLAEDDRIIRTQLEVKLSALGHSVTAVVDGQALLENLEVVWPDVVVTDDTMPRRSGLEVLGQMRLTVAHAGRPVIVFSARDIEQAVWSIGGIFVLKPNIDELVTTLDRIASTMH